MQRMNWTDICRREEYAGRWVALDGCRYDSGSGRATEGAVIDVDEDLVELMNRIREEMANLGDLHRAVTRAMATTGFAVTFTAATLIAGVAMWVVLSDLRFQSDSALLLTVMLVLNAVAAMFLVPAWVVVFKPAFITRARLDEDGVVQVD